MKHLCLFLLLALPFSGCSSVFWGDNSPETKKALPAEAQVKVQQPPSQKTNVELSWLVPETAVDGFVVFYGYAADMLEFQERVAIEDLKKIQDTQYGLIYRYILENVEPQRKLYVAIASFRGEKVSPQSTLIEVPAEIP